GRRRGPRWRRPERRPAPCRRSPGRRRPGRRRWGRRCRRRTGSGSAAAKGAWPWSWLLVDGLGRKAYPENARRTGFFSAAEPGRRGIGRHVEVATAAQPGLDVAPPGRLEDARVGIKQGFAQRRGQAEEAREQRREHIRGAGIEPVLQRPRLVLIARFGQLAELHLLQQAELVEVVEQRAAMARDAEVLQQQVARENAAARQV